MDLLGEMNAAALISKIVAGQAGIASAPGIIAAVRTEAAAAIARPVGRSWVASPQGSGRPLRD